MSNTNPLQLLRSSTANKRPLAAGLVDGRPAINTNSASPGLFFKDSTGGLVKVGPVHVGTTAPNVSPASGGATGNSVGEQWLDTTGGTYVLKIWDGSAWRSESGTFVDVNGDVMTGALVMDNQQQVRFRETTANGTNYIALQAPASVASDKTITLPDVNGTVVTTGDTGTVTSTMILDGTIVNADVNASAAIAGTKISPDFGSQNVTTTGTNTAASFIPTSSTVPTSGVYLPAANSVAISTGGTGRLFVDASGRVGINSAPSLWLLEVKQDSASSAGGAYPVIQVNNPNANGYAGVYLNDSTAQAGLETQRNTGHLGLQAGGSERLRITSAGLVGIGTSSPSTLLTVQGDATLRVASGNVGIGLQTGSLNGSWYLNDADDSLRWYSSTGGDRLTISSSGNVGIGTTSPTQRLQITDGSLSNFYVAPGYNSGQGTLLATGGSEYLAFATNGLANERLRITSAGLVGIGTSSPSDPLHIAVSGANSANIRLQSGDGRTYNIGSTGSGYGSSGKFIIYDVTAGAERFCINSSGNVGIGTSSPGTVLHCAINSSATSIAAAPGTAFFQNLNATSGAINNLLFVNSGGFGSAAIYTTQTQTGNSGDNLVLNTKSSGGAWNTGVVIDTAGRLGIGTASPGSPLTIESSAGNQVKITYPSIASYFLNATSGGDFAINKDGTERARIDSSGRLLVGTSTSRTNFFNTATFGSQLLIEQAGSTAGSFIQSAFVRNSADTEAAHLVLGKTRGTTVGSNTVVQSGDQLGVISFEGADGSELVDAASIQCVVDGTPGANDMPGRLVFSTTADGASSPTERLRITSAGLVGVGTSSPGYALDTVASSGSAVAARFRGNGGANNNTQIRFYGNNAATDQWAIGGSVATSDTGRDFHIYDLVANANRLAIDSSGRVGIGTSSPGAQTESRITGGGAAPATSGTSQPNAAFRVSGTGTTGVLDIGCNSSAPWIQSTDRTDLSQKYSLLLNPNGGSVGIGTTTVDEKLHVSGGNIKQQLAAATNGGLSVNNGTNDVVAIGTGGFAANGGSVTDGGIRATNSLVFATGSGTPERARIDSSGRLLVGTSTARANYFNSTATTQLQIEKAGGGGGVSVISDSVGDDPAILILGKSNNASVGGNTAVAVDNFLGTVSFQGNDGSEFVDAARISCYVDGTPGANDMPGRLVFSTTADGASSPTEACRINSSQQLLVNTNASIASFNDGRIEVASKASQLAIAADATASSAIGIGIRGNTSTTAISFFNASDGATCGTIVLNSGSTSYNTSSDYRLKENVTAVTDGITRLQQLKPSRFNFIADPDKTVDGFIAHEVQTIVPEAITGEKDAVDDEGNPQYQGIDQSKMVPLVVAALQEAITKIETLEARLTAAGL